MMHEILPAMASPPPRPLDVCITASTQRCYPGEAVTLAVQMLATADMLPATLALSLPAMLSIQSAEAMSGAVPSIVATETGQQGVVWRDVLLRPNTPANFTLNLRVQHAGWRWQHAENHRLLHLGCLVSLDAAGQDPIEDHVSIAVFRRGDLVKFLPGIYQSIDDEFDAPACDFIWRFLMLFERLWDPIEERVEHIDRYFDRSVAPSFMLPWLAWALAFMPEEDWDEMKRRRVLGEMVRLYRKRGTREGLKALLALYLDERPSIFEHGAGCLRLGESKLGSTAALGDRSRPHEFTVTFARGLSADEQALARALIAANKPAQSEFDLRFGDDTHFAIRTQTLNLSEEMKS